jgi:RNA polymerase sigma-70 factor (ECF subfamily)
MIAFPATEPVLSDSAILFEIERNRKKGFQQLYTKYWKKLLQYANTRIADKTEAEEILQDIFTRLFTRGIHLKEHDKLQPYLKQCIKNTAINHFKKKQIYKRHLQLGAMHGTPSYDPVTKSSDLNDFHKQLAEVLSTMNAECRTVFTLSKKNEFSTKEIAAILQRPGSTIEKQLRRAILFIRKELIKDPEYANLI